MPMGRLPRCIPLSLCSQHFRFATKARGAPCRSFQHLSTLPPVRKAPHDGRRSLFATAAASVGISWHFAGARVPSSCLLAIGSGKRTDGRHATRPDDLSGGEAAQQQHRNGSTSE